MQLASSHINRATTHAGRHSSPPIPRPSGGPHRALHRPRSRSFPLVLPQLHTNPRHHHHELAPSPKALHRAAQLPPLQARSVHVCRCRLICHGSKQCGLILAPSVACCGCGPQQPNASWASISPLHRMHHHLPMHVPNHCRAPILALPSALTLRYLVPLPPA